MPDLGWDATEEIEIQENTKETAQEKSEINKMAHPPKTMVTIVILVLTFIEIIKSHIQKTQEICRKTSGKKRNQENRS